MMKARDMFRAWGMTESEIGSVLPSLTEDNGEADQDVVADSDAYLSDVDSDEEVDEWNEYVDGLTEEEVDELFEAGFKRISTSQTVRRANRKERRLWLKTPGGRAYMQHQSQKRRTSGYKMKQKKHRAKVQRRGGPRKGYVFREEDLGKGLVQMQKTLLENVMEIADAIDRDPEARFEEFATAFNRIADLGELAAMKLMEDDEEAAIDVLNLSLAAESVLKEMEDMDGSLSIEEDRELEETLADAMESVGRYMDHYGLLDEDFDLEGDEDLEEEDEAEDDEEEDGLSEAFLETANELREARGAKQKGRFILNPKSRKKLKGASRWGKVHGKGAAKRQIAARNDVEEPQALLGYLKKVKAGKIAPGQPLKGNLSKTGKRLNKGARAAKRAAGK